LIGYLSQPNIQQFMKDHETHDPSLLVLGSKKNPDIDIKLVASQIQSRQKARNKLPEWYHTEGVIFPPPLSMEQCSSEVTARYKAAHFKGKRMADITGGAGVDTFYLSKGFESCDYVERNPTVFETACHNFKQLDTQHIKCHCEEAESFLSSNASHYDLIYIDPARRGEGNRKVFLLSDCEPDLVRLMSLLLSKAKEVLVKTSPMLDINEVLTQVPGIQKVFVVSVDNECKEVLYLVKPVLETDIEMVTVNIKKNGSKEDFSYQLKEELQAYSNFSLPLKFIYEPNASIMKAGAFRVIGHQLDLYKLHPNSHIYTSNRMVENFPGRMFVLKDILSLNKKELAKHLPNGKANITVRNFPLPVEAIRKKTGIKEGGEDYLIATTDINQKPVILLTKKV
jgi:hypothetical protein